MIQKRNLQKSAAVVAAAVTISLSFAAAPLRADPGATIVQTALAVNAETSEFSTLIAAVIRADLVDALDGRRQFTVFAPTDAAFAKLGLNADNIDTVPLDTLKHILLYHVAPGERFAADVLHSRRIRMLGRQFAPVGPGATIAGANIIATDIDASNGVIHVVDSVLVPPTQ